MNSFSQFFLYENTDYQLNVTNISFCAGFLFVLESAFIIYKIPWKFFISITFSNTQNWKIYKNSINFLFISYDLKIFFIFTYVCTLLLHFLWSLFFFLSSSFLLGLYLCYFMNQNWVLFDSLFWFCFLFN